MSAFLHYPQARKAVLPAQLTAQLATLNCGVVGNGDCKTLGVGGVSKILMAERTELLRFTMNTSGQIDSFVSKPLTIWSVLTAEDNKTELAYERSLDENASLFKLTLSGQLYQLTTLQNFVFNRLINLELAVILKDRFGVYWFLGSDAPVRIATQTGTTGSGQQDYNGYNFSFKFNERVAPVEVLADAADSIVLDANDNCSIPYITTLPILTFGTCNIQSFLSTTI